MLIKRLHGQNVTLFPPPDHPLLRTMREKLQRERGDDAISARREPLSVMITVFNGAEYLAESIESVLAQTYRPIELIVLDDGSTDESGDVAQRFGSALRTRARRTVG